MSRRQAIEDALNKGITLPPLDPTKDFHEQVLVEEHRHHRVAPGGTTKLLSTLPPEQARRVVEVANLYDYQLECGRHGRPQDVLEAFEVDELTARAVHDGLTVDYVADQLQSRRGSDADLPLPELTRRDSIAAAIEGLS